MSSKLRRQEFLVSLAAPLAVASLLRGMSIARIKDVSRPGVRYSEISQSIDQPKKLMAEGAKAVRLQVGVPGMAAYGGGRGPRKSSGFAALQDPVFEPEPYVRRTLQLFEVGGKELGPDVALLLDVHERVPPRQAVQFAKDIEQFRLFYLEAALSPGNLEYFRQIRAHCTTLLAMGELFNTPHEWEILIENPFGSLERGRYKN